MSFILDALKKSDAERQKRSTPGFADIPVTRGRRPSPRWLWVVGSLLAINFVVLTALLVRPGSGPDSGAVSPPAAEPPPPADAAAPAERPASRPFADFVAEARQGQPDGGQAVAASPRPAPQPGTGTGTETVQEPPRSTSVATATGAAAASRSAAGRNVRTEPANTFESLRADGTLQLPDLHLDIHVYSETPAERFVFINMKKYRENETLAEGPSIRDIAPEGVILEHRGTVFLLPRQ